MSLKKVMFCLQCGKCIPPCAEQPIENFRIMILCLIFQLIEYIFFQCICQGHFVTRKITYFLRVTGQLEGVWGGALRSGGKRN